MDPNQTHHPLTPEEEENLRPRMGILLNGRHSTDSPSPLQLPPLSVHSDEELDRIVSERQDTIENSFRENLTNSNTNSQNRYQHYTLISNDSESEEEGPRSLLLNHHFDNNDDSDIDSEEEEIRLGGRRTLLLNNNNNNDNNENSNNGDLQNVSQSQSIGSPPSANESVSSVEQTPRRSNIAFVEVQEEEEEEEEQVEEGNNNNRRRFILNDPINNGEENGGREENDLIDEIDIAQEVENHQAEQEARQENIQNENFGIHCKYLSERLMNKSLSWTLNLCLSSLQSKFTFEYDEFLNLLYKYERIRDENIFDKNLFLLKMNIEYYQKRFQSYKRHLIYIMSACRNLLVISDDPYYNNFNNVAEENRHVRQHLNETTDNDMYNTILNPESVASIRNLLNVLSHSFLKIEKYDKDLFVRDNYYISSNILTNNHSENDNDISNSIQDSKNITVYSVPKITIVNSTVNTIKEDKIYASKRDKGQKRKKDDKDKTKDRSSSSSSSSSTSTSSSSPSLSDKNNYKSSSTTGASTSTSNETIANNDNNGSESSENHDNDYKSNSNAYHAVYNCILVCRHWRHLAQKELYHTLSFNYTNIINSYILLKIAASLEVICKSEKISPTRTIVLRVSHDNKVPDSKEWYDRKGELAFNMILRNCPNLKSIIKKIFKNLESSLRNLDLIQVDCEEDDFDYIIPYLKNVEELGLMITISFSDNCLKLINRHCPKLEYLNFTGLINISDHGFENLFSTEKDSVFMMENLSTDISDEYLFKTRTNNNGRGNSVQIPKNTRVKRINLSDCIDISDDGLKIISDHCEALEAISIDDCPRITDEGFEAFIKQQSKIKFLSIANSDSLTNKSIDCLNKYCPNIEKLNIKGCLKIREKAERNTFSRAFIDYLNNTFSTEDFDDMFLKWNQ
ncbi:hypothetical protein PIROE2DRAFT_62961 [Piromyces sp. E2]|nr:hypothetical protein PIROE2DRAFT_62961 [Piromyces sp. E2]|eukprot:OUM60749.1 hypothetical protein PIROE2DRAFT_62961 [Piromyces sp. E2]